MSESKFCHDTGILTYTQISLQFHVYSGCNWTVEIVNCAVIMNFGWSWLIHFGNIMFYLHISIRNVSLQSFMMPIRSTLFLSSWYSLDVTGAVVVICFIFRSLPFAVLHFMDEKVRTIKVTISAAFIISVSLVDLCFQRMIWYICMIHKVYFTVVENILSFLQHSSSGSYHRLRRQFCWEEPEPRN